MNKKIVTLVCLCMIGVLAIGQAFTASRGFSDMENRYLAAAPQMTWQNVKTGSYMDDLETYLADHVPGRDQWVLAKNAVLRLTGRRQIGNVFFAPENRLLQVQDISFTQLEENLSFLAAWIETVPETIPVDFLLAPNASMIYRDQLADWVQTYDPEQAAGIVDQMLPDRIRLTFPESVLQEHREEAVYFKSDHHWTMLGAAYAWQELRQNMGVDGPDPLQRESRRMSSSFLGSVYSQAPVPGYPGEAFDVLETPGLQARWQSGDASGTVMMEERFEEKDQYTAFLGGNYGLTHITNETAQSDEKILILKDSYANIVVPFLAEYYQEIVMVDLRYYRQNLNELMAAEKIEHVICIYNLDFLCTDTNFTWLSMAS